MDISTFIGNYQEAFGRSAELPIVFWYSDVLENPTEKTNGCFFKAMHKVRDGEIISLNGEVIGCGGGKLYTGFSRMPEHVPGFVSLKERYKKTPEMVKEFVEQMHIELTEKKYLHFARIDKVASFDHLEGLFFLATPDVLSGLTAWAFYDNNSADMVCTPFGSGCSSIVTQAVRENREGGKRTFIGLLDPSVRSHLEPGILSFMIPMSRFREMYHTMRECCLFDTNAWAKIKERISAG